jgi:hypothetical protein
MPRRFCPQLTSCELGFQQALLSQSQENGRHHKGRGNRMNSKSIMFAYWGEMMLRYVNLLFEFSRSI